MKPIEGIIKEWHLFLIIYVTNMPEFYLQSVAGFKTGPFGKRLLPLFKIALGLFFRNHSEMFWTFSSMLILKWFGVGQVFFNKPKSFEVRLLNEEGGQSVQIPDWDLKILRLVFGRSSSAAWRLLHSRWRREGMRPWKDCISKLWPWNQPVTLISIH